MPFGSIVTNEVLEFYTEDCFYQTIQIIQLLFESSLFLVTRPHRKFVGKSNEKIPNKETLLYLNFIFKNKKSIS